MKVKTLIISSLYDFSTDLIAQQLEKNNFNYVRLNKECFEDYRISLDPIRSKLNIHIGQRSYFIDNSLKNIFYRQPIFLRNAPQKKLSIKEQLNRSQWMAFLKSLLVFSQAKWVNNPHDTYLSETKSFQLMLAQQLGFSVPKTLMGNNVSDFQLFNNKAIIKSLDTVLLMDGSDCLFTYSTISDTAKLRDDEVFEAPLTIQEYIYPKVDIRVTIIGDQIFAVKITSGNKGIDEDWRILEKEKIQYTDIKLPNDVEAKCFSLMKALKLNFGAIDLIRSKDDYYFIEINPTGEWGWLVSETRRIDIAISKWLMN